MNQFRVLAVAAALGASAGLANAQSVSVASMQAVAEMALAQVRPSVDYLSRPSASYPAAPAYPLARELASQEEAVRQADDRECCDANWYVRAVQNGVAAWQRMRALCASSCDMGGCCQPACAQVGHVKPGTNQAAAGSAKGMQPNCAFYIVGGNGNERVVVELVGQQPPSCGIKDFTQLKCPLGFTAAHATPPCCCAKACACCEMCKNTTQVRMQTTPVPAVPMAWTAVQPVPAPALVPPPAGARMVIGMPTSRTPGMPGVAHLVTPDFEAHCHKITHHDGHVILEGNVMFLSKKNAQPMRIDAARVVVNLRDGSFMVDSSVSMPMGMTHTTYEVSPPMALPVPVAPTGVQYRVIELPTPARSPLLPQIPR